MFYSITEQDTTTNKLFCSTAEQLPKMTEPGESTPKIVIWILVSLLKIVNSYILDIIKNNCDKMTAMFFPIPLDFRKWLKKNHKKETQLLVGFYKVSAKKPSITWPQSVDEALCFGWIDGVRKNIDEESYSVRFTPRRTTSIWSAINIKKVEELTKAGLMTAEGLKAFSLRTENKSKIYSYEKEDVVLDPLYEKQFKKNKLAWEFFTTQARSYKKVIVHWIMNGKLEKTRLYRLEKAIKESEVQRRIV